MVQVLPIITLFSLLIAVIFLSILTASFWYQFELGWGLRLRADGVLFKFKQSLTSTGYFKKYLSLCKQAAAMRPAQRKTVLLLWLNCAAIYLIHYSCVCLFVYFVCLL